MSQQGGGDRDWWMEPARNPRLPLQALYPVFFQPIKLDFRHSSSLKPKDGAHLLAEKRLRADHQIPGTAPVRAGPPGLGRAGSLLIADQSSGASNGACGSAEDVSCQEGKDFALLREAATLRAGPEPEPRRPSCPMGGRPEPLSFCTDLCPGRPCCAQKGKQDASTAAIVTVTSPTAVSVIARLWSVSCVPGSEKSTCEMPFEKRTTEKGADMRWWHGTSSEPEPGESASSTSLVLRVTEHPPRWKQCTGESCMQNVTESAGPQGMHPSVSVRLSSVYGCKDTAAVVLVNPGRAASGQPGSLALASSPATELPAGSLPLTCVLEPHLQIHVGPVSQGNVHVGFWSCFSEQPPSLRTLQQVPATVASQGNVHVGFWSYFSEQPPSLRTLQQVPATVALGMCCFLLLAELFAARSHSYSCATAASPARAPSVAFSLSSVFGGVAESAP
ncbi:hypothetical protein CB1_001222006 [Camelus ferus]|nr:hypothetical protein CB1_001222006 [Camelus ferus]